MGACGSSEGGSSPSPGAGEAAPGDSPIDMAQISAQIDKQLRNAENEEKSQVKLLLLGTGLENLPFSSNGEFFTARL
jgi:hypothetical protein